jgi:hypothetical protein
MRDFHPRCFAVSSHDGMPNRQQPWGKEVMLDEKTRSIRRLQNAPSVDTCQAFPAILVDVRKPL